MLQTVMATTVSPLDVCELMHMEEGGECIVLSVLLHPVTVSAVVDWLHVSQRRQV